MSRVSPQQRLAAARQRQQAARQPARAAATPQAAAEGEEDLPPPGGTATLSLTGTLTSADGAQSWPVTLTGEVPLDAMPDADDQAVRDALEALRRALHM